MKKLLLLCTVLLALLAFAACADEEPHTHAFGDWSVTTQATCMAEGKQTRTCSCGATETQSIPATGVHTYGTDNRCTACGEQLVYTEGLVMTPIKDGAAYAVTHIGGTNVSEIVLPAYHEGKPVTELRGLLVDAQGVLSAQRVTSVVLSANVTFVDPKVFEGCTSLVAITVAADNAVYSSVNGCLVETDKHLLVVGCNGAQLPSDGSVTAIGAYAYYKNTALTELTIPHSVVTIAPDAFYGCEGLVSVVIKSNESNADPAQPNPVLDGWIVRAETGAVSVNVNDAAENACLLTGAYQGYEWSRIAADDSIRY